MRAFCWDAPFNRLVALQGAASALTGNVHFHGITPAIPARSVILLPTLQKPARIGLIGKNRRRGAV